MSCGFFIHLFIFGALGHVYLFITVWDGAISSRTLLCVLFPGVNITHFAREETQKAVRTDRDTDKRRGINISC